MLLPFAGQSLPSTSTRQVPQRHSMPLRIRLLRPKLRMLKPLSNPLLLLLLLLPPRPPPRKSSYTKVKHRHSKDDNNISTVIGGVSCETEAQTSVDQGEEENRWTQVFVHFGEFGWGLGLFPGAVVEEAKAELD